MEDKLRVLLSNQGRGEENFDEQLITSCRQFFTRRVEFRPPSRPDTYLENLRTRYQPLNKISVGMEQNVVAMDTSPMASGSHDNQDNCRMATMDGVPQPKRTLYDPELLEMKWKTPRSVGSGLSNMGNTCFLNSVLQCLTYTSPLFNYLTSNNHSQMCHTQGFCAMCELQRHCSRAFNTASSVMRPMPIVQNLKAIAKHFRQGRQEDAHEFLRYFVDGLQKSCLQGCPRSLDPHSKATTVIHQIFGGYHRSQVKCLTCMKTSDTFDPLLDISLDIKNCPTLFKALQKSTKSDLLDGDNKYACPFCKKMTRAQKKLTIHRLPRVLTIQLKRFEYNSLFGGKINKPVAYTEYVNMRPFLSEPQGPSEWYQLYGVLVHSGFSSHSGHYYCYIRNSTGVWYCMNDAQVMQVSLATVLQQEAYLLFYIQDKEYCPPDQGTRSSATPTSKGTAQHLKVRPDPNFLGTPVVRRPNVDKTGTPLIKPLQKPTGVVTPSPQTTPQSHKVPSPSNGGLTHEFSIPLRKTEIRSERRKQTTSPPTTTPPPGPATSDPQKVTSTPSTPILHPKFSSPGFTPRVITAKPRKLHKSPLFPKVDSPVKAANEKNPEIETNSTQMEESEEKKEAPPDMARKKEEAGHVQTILDIAEMSLCESSTNSSGYSSTMATKEQKFIGPLLPAQFRSPPPSPAIQPFSFVSPTTKSPKVARVQPQRHSPQPPNVKPIARVLPSPQVSSPRELTAETPLLSPGPEELVESKKDKLKDEKGDESSNNKDGEKKEKEEGDGGGLPQPSTPSSEPHVNSTSQWKVTGLVYGPALPNDYDTTAHGWTVTPMTQPSEEQSSTGFKTKKQKKKKKRYRKHSIEYDYDIDSGSSEGESDKRNQDRLTEKASRKRHDSEELRRTKHRDREGSPTPERKPHKDSRDGSGQVQDGKYRKHRRHYSEYSDSREHREGKKRHYSDADDRHSRKHFYHRRRPSSSDSEEEYHRRHRVPTRDHASDRHTVLKPSHYGNRYHLSDSSFREERRRERHSPPDGRSEGFKYWRHQHKLERFNRRSPERREREKPYHYHHRDQERRRDVERDRHWSGKCRRNLDGEYERSGRKRTYSHRDRSPSPDHRRHEHWSRRHKMEAASDGHRERNERKRSPAPEVEWDASLKDLGRHATTQVPHSQKWDGSQRSETVEHLTSHAHDKLGDIVKSWDGGKNAIDSTVVEGESRKRRRDPWDEELDKGKVKKVKKHKEEDHKSHHLKNPFQEYQNKRNKWGNSTHHHSA